VSGLNLYAVSKEAAERLVKACLGPKETPFEIAEREARGDYLGFTCDVEAYEVKTAGNDGWFVRAKIASVNTRVFPLVAARESGFTVFVRRVSAQDVERPLHTDTVSALVSARNP